MIDRLGQLARRDFLRVMTQLGGAVAVATAIPPSGGARAATADSPQPVDRLAETRYVIVNADDFGESAGINRGIIEGHQRGIVTSASLMVDAAATEAAVALATRYPRLGVGLHACLSPPRGGSPSRDVEAVAEELDRQVRRFVRLTGSPPTHLDSHHHAHLKFNIARVFLEAGSRYRIPVRGFSSVVYVGGFYGQWTYGKTDARHISSDYLISLLRATELGVTEISCHPGYRDAASDADYNDERELELRALADPAVKAAVRENRIRLINYRDYRQLALDHATARRPGATMTQAAITK